MRETATRTSAGGRVRLLATLVLATATIALLALIPTVQARAGAPAITLPPTGEVESLLGQTPLGTLPAGRLAEVLSQLEGLEGIEPAALDEALTKVIGELAGKGATLEELLGGNEAVTMLRERLVELLGPLGTHLEELLAGNPQAKLTEALEAAGVSEIIGKLLSGSAEPQVLIEQILQSLSPERLQSLLGTILGGEPVSTSTVEELAHQLGTSPEALAAQLGKTTEQLPATAMALLAPLANGERLGVLPSAGGLTVALLKGAGETVGSTGGTGGLGGSGAANTPAGSVTLTTTRATPTSTSAGVAGVKAGKLRIVSHKVKGKKATVVVEVPAAGNLSAGGKGVRSIKREAAKAERVTIHPALTKASNSSLRRHHRRLKVPVKVSFKQVGGPSSSAVVALTYR
ncbi:MAG: hypothetical protein JWM60_2889 [Solirubrobacterales bacterium]|nr:hypothetical protein [Solirubrobacterales bacterium]